MSKDRLAVFTNYDQALEETVLMGLFHPVVHGCFQLVGITIDTIRLSQCRKRPSLKSRSARFSAH